jgi:hypothetical protein
MNLDFNKTRRKTNIFGDDGMGCIMKCMSKTEDESRDSTRHFKTYPIYYACDTEIMEVNVLRLPS